MRRLTVSLMLLSLLTTVGPGPVCLAAAETVTPGVSPEDLLERLESLARQVRELQADSERPKPPSHPTELMQTLLRRVEELEAEVAALHRQMQDDQAQINEAWETLDAQAEAEGRKTHLTVYGTLAFENLERRDSIFDAEAFELVLSGRPHKRLGFFAEIEFERAATVGGERSGEVLVEQAYASYTLYPWLDLRAGVVLVPFGNFVIDHYAPHRDVISKSLVSRLLAPSDWTDNGIGLAGSFVLGGPWIMGYEAWVVAGLGADISALGTRDARQPFGVDNNNNKALATRWSLSRGSDLTFGASLYTGKYDDQSQYRMTGTALDFSWHTGPVHLTGEIDRFDAERPSVADGRFDGFYLRAVYDLPKTWLSRGWHGTSFPQSRLSAVVQYDEVRTDDPATDADGANRESRITLGLNYRPTHQWVLKLNYERSHGTGTKLFQGTTRGILASIGFVF